MIRTFHLDRNLLVRRQDRQILRSVHRQVCRKSQTLRTQTVNTANARAKLDYYETCLQEHFLTEPEPQRSISLEYFYGGRIEFWENVHLADLAASRSTEGAANAAVERHAQRMIARLAHGIEPERRHISSVGITTANQILEVLGYNTDMVNGNKLDPLEEPPEDFQISLDFDMSKYADESWAARPFANALKEILGKAGVPLDRGGFKVEDVHRTSNGQVTLSMGKISFVGGLDTAIVPSALISPLWKQLRIGIKLKQSNAQQAAWAAANIPPEDSQKLRKQYEEEHQIGKEVAERGKAQDPLYLLAAYSKSQFPLDLYVTDGVAFDLLQMRETSLFIYQNIPARTALHHMSKLLCQAPREHNFEAAKQQEVLERVRPDGFEALQHLKTMLKGDKISYKTQLSLIGPNGDDPKTMRMPVEFA